MKKIALILFTVLGIAYNTYSQVPEYFNYQAVLRNSEGELVVNTNVNFQLSILEGSTEGLPVFTETQLIKSNSFGVCNLKIGEGSDASGSLLDLDWGSTEYFLKVGVDITGNTSFDEIGAMQLVSVPYSYYSHKATSSTNSVNAEIAIYADHSDTSEVAKKLDEDVLYFTNTDTLFAVKDREGNIVFAVFPDGAKVYVNEGVKGRVGGFAVTGRNPTKADYLEEEYLLVTPDSTRVWVNEDVTKARVGGFAVTGRNPTKGMSGDYLVVTKDSTRIWVNEDETKARVGGFAVTGRNPTKGMSGDYLLVTSDSTRIYLNDTTNTKARVGGFAVTGRNPTKGPNDDYLRVTRDSTRIYITESSTKARVGGFAVTGRNPTKGDVTKDYLNVSGNFSADAVNNESRVMWYPQKSALLAGEVHVGSADSVGTNSTALGYRSIAMGEQSQSFGFQTKALGNYSTAIGNNAMAESESAFAFGDGVIASGANSFAFGYNNQSVGQYSIATGNSSITYGASSVAMGYSNNSGGTGSATFGYDNSAAGDYALAAGRLSSAVGTNSVAIGYSNYSSATGSSSFGYDNNATGDYSLVAGRLSTASGSNSVAIGYSNNSSKTGSASFGYDNDATGDYSLAAGYSNVSSGLGSAVFGYDNTASGDYSVAIGRQASVAGDYSLAIGYLSSSSANYSYTIGESNQALQQYSFAFGKGCTANENFAFAFGVTASSTGEGAYAFGAGASAAGSKSYAFGEAAYTEGYGSYALGSNAKSYGTNSVAIGTYATVNSNYSSAIGYNVLTGSSGWDYTTVLGKYNSTTATSPLLVVGNGTSTSARSNALVLQTDGDLGLGVTNPGQKLDVNGNIRLTGGDRWLEINSGFLDIRPHDDTYGLILRDHTGYTSIWSSFRTVPSTTDYLHISMNSTSTSEGIIVSDNGSVGVGVLPGYKLDVNGEITSRSQNAFRLRNTTYSSILRNDNTAFYLLLTDSGNPDGGWNSLRPVTVGLSTGDVSIASTLHAKNSGYVGIGTSSPQNLFHVQGSRDNEYIAQFRNTSYTEPHGIKVVVGDYGNYVAFVGCKTGTEHLGGLYANTSGEIYLSGTSDRRVKNSITDTEIDATDIISELKVRDFYFNERPAENKTTGFIAQEVMEVLPEMVIYDKEQDLFMVSKDFLVPYLTKAVQEQQYEIDLIKQNNEKLQKENEELKQKLNEIIELLKEE